MEFIPLSTRQGFWDGNLPVPALERVDLAGDFDGVVVFSELFEAGTGEGVEFVGCELGGVGFRDRGEDALRAGAEDGGFDGGEGAVEVRVRLLGGGRFRGSGEWRAGKRDLLVVRV